MGFIGVAMLIVGATLVAMTREDEGPASYAGWALLSLGVVVALAALLRGPWQRRTLD